MSGLKSKYGFTPNMIDVMRRKWDAMRKSTISVEFDDFDDFLRWASKSGGRYGKKIVREDTNGPYSPDNCKWVDVPVSKATEESKRIWASRKSPGGRCFGMYTRIW